MRCRARLQWAHRGLEVHDPFREDRQERVVGERAVTSGEGARVVERALQDIALALEGQHASELEQRAGGSPLPPGGGGQEVWKAG